MADHPVLYASRIKVLDGIFADASASSYEKFLEIQEAINGADDNPEDLMRLERDALTAGVQAIVMSAMCFEAAIYNYAATQLGDGYVRKHLDRLGVIAKWVVIPRIVCGREVRKDQIAFATFREVISERNRLVHWKSEDMPLGDAAQVERILEKLEKENSRLEANVHKSFRAIVLMSLEMDTILEPWFNPLPSFDRERTHPWDYSPCIDEIINECRQDFRGGSA